MFRPRYVAEQISFNLRGMRYCAKAWGRADALPVLALHGWLDNAASFDKLAPHMDSCRIVALDLPGHGLSDHCPPQAHYNIWDDLPHLLMVLDALGWSQCHVLGHSRGATVGLMLAASMPDRICSLSLLDGLLPLSFGDTDPARQLGTFLRDSISRVDRPAPVYPTQDEAVRARATRGKVPESVIRPVVVRALKRHPEGWTWRNDPRLLGASAFKLGEREKHSILHAVTQPGLLFLAEHGFAKSPEIKEQCELCPSLKYESCPGHHHFHMDVQAEDIGTRLDAHIKHCALA